MGKVQNVKLLCGYEKCKYVPWKGLCNKQKAKIVFYFESTCLLVVFPNKRCIRGSLILNGCDYFYIHIWKRQFSFSNVCVLGCDLYISTQIWLRAVCTWVPCCKSFAGEETDFSHICILRHIALTSLNILRPFKGELSAVLVDCTSLIATAVRSLCSVDAPGKFTLRATKYPFSCLSIRRVLSLSAHSLSFSFRLSDIPVADTTVSLKPYSITGELGVVCLLLGTLLLFSGDNSDNWPWASRQTAFQSKHAEGGI